MFNSDGQRKDFPIRKGVLTVGRKNTCGLRIPLSSVSREHFRIEQEDQKLILRDLGSSNGTFYNDQRVQEAELNAGDTIRVGPVTFIVVIDGRPAEIEPIRTVLAEGSGQVSAGVEQPPATEPTPSPAPKPAPEAEAGRSPEPTPEPAEAPAPAADAAPAAEKPEAIEQSDEMPSAVEEENHTPTVNLDEEEEEDPIAALEALAAATGDDDDEPIPFIDDEDEDEEEQSSNRQRSQ